ncbi:response regulator transcription factor [Synoicihabitans lomoniglobus]|uniref:Response regulator transcription factor n=1 Tax=Synoicihabitans lomoniglobus TaxID=2909285 RepID=A0AAF0CMR4_9BACT|nr:response regulator transcription factor [Opitutaceae bacterium LMO-M01]WED63425.1 response regulator transcription factor [Opitutaceae bacterium LMO-M01]
MTAPSPSPTLLIVDDTPDNIAVLFDFLAEQGFNVLVCESGKAALDTLGVEEPDLILLDVMMPGMDGWETCRRIKQLPAGREVPVFFMTALGEPYDKVRGLEAGAVDYLTKPVYPEEVLARIQTHLEIRRLQKQQQEQNDLLDAALQRSIFAERALAESLGRAILLVRLADHEILFMTDQAKTIVSDHGGVPALLSCLAENADTFGRGEGCRYTLKCSDENTADGTLLVTLEVQRAEPTPEDLRSLGLTPRETEILFWVAQGKTSPDIAIILGMQVCTVKKHVENFLPKLGVETRLAAAIRANEILTERT